MQNTRVRAHSGTAAGYANGGRVTDHVFSGGWGRVNFMDASDADDAGGRLRADGTFDVTNHHRRRAETK